MEFKSGCGWRCCYDPETGLYTAEIGAGTNHNLYEITEEVYNLADASDAEGTKTLIRTGRHLYMTVNDRCGLPYTVVLDSDYKKLCPWAETVVSGEIWDEDLTDAVELFESEEKNRDQRRTKRAERQNESDKKQ